jgi:hypothetical protein
MVSQKRPPLLQRQSKRSISPSTSQQQQALDSVFRTTTTGTSRRRRRCCCCCGTNSYQSRYCRYTTVHRTSVHDDPFVLPVLLLIMSIVNLSVHNNWWVYYHLSTTTHSFYPPLVVNSWTTTNVNYHRQSLNRHPHLHNRWDTNIRHINTSPTLLLQAEKNSNDVDTTDSTNNGNNIDTILDTVSDGEALLACYAYLQRKNILSQWSTHNQQSKKTIVTSPILSYTTQESGYFWNNLEELPDYRVPPKQPRTHTTTTEVVSVIQFQNRTNNNHMNKSHPVTTTGTSNFQSIVGTDYYHDRNHKVSTGTRNPVPSTKVFHVNETDDTRSSMIRQRPTIQSDEATVPTFVNLTSTTLYYPNDNGQSVRCEMDDTIDEEEEEENESSHFWNPSDGASRQQQRQFLQRSNRIRQQFQNQTWKEQWYQRRWGTTTMVDIPTHRIRHQRNVERRLQDKILSSSQSSRTRYPQGNSAIGSSSNTVASSSTIPEATSSNYILHSQYVSRMDEDTIAKAIVTYINANQRRSIQRRNTNQQRSTFLTQQYYNIVQNCNANMTDTNRNVNTTNIVTNRTFARVSQPTPFHYHPIVSTALSMEEQQRRRSEKSKKAYQTRLQNERNRENELIRTPNSTKKRKSVLKNDTNDDAGNSNGLTAVEYPVSLIDSTAVPPKEAIERIDRFLCALQQCRPDTDEWGSDGDDDINTRAGTSASKTHPLVLFWNDVHQLSSFQCDVQIILRPTKLSHRKSLLLRIMKHLFHARGMCIPVSTVSDTDPTIATTNDTDTVSNNDFLRRTTMATSGYKFMTQASMQELGLYITHRIQHTINDLC